MLKVWAEEIGLLNRAVGKLESEIHNSLKYNKALICDPEITKYRKQWETLEFEDKKFADSKWKKYQELRKNIDRFKNKFSGKNKLNVEEAQTFASLLERQLTDAKEEATYQVQNFKRELRASEKEAVPLIQKIEQLQKDAEANVTKLKIKEFEKEEKKEKDEEASEQKVNKLLKQIPNQQKANKKIRKRWTPRRRCRCSQRPRTKAARPRRRSGPRARSRRSSTTPSSSIRTPTTNW